MSPFCPLSHFPNESQDTTPSANDTGRELFRLFDGSTSSSLCVASTSARLWRMPILYPPLPYVQFDTSLNRRAVSRLNITTHTAWRVKVGESGLHGRVSPTLSASPLSYLAYANPHSVSSAIVLILARPRRVRSFPYHPPRFAPLPSFAHALAPLHAVSPSLGPMVPSVPFTFCMPPRFSRTLPTSAIWRHSLSLLSPRPFSPQCRRVGRCIRRRRGAGYQ